MPRDGESDVKTGRFVLGVALVCVGGELFLRSAGLANLSTWDAELLSIADLRLTTGFVLAGFGFGLVLVYVDPQSLLAWMLVAATAGAFVLGVALHLEARLWRMPPAELGSSIALLVAGVGIFLGSVRLSPVD